ncbi:hypothetical protein [Aequorivita sinensis]|uniref:hypothetical protein n=1 Tax=Aequorivita sinensis TaxID=1382458 RepID=UPI0011233DE7|nr:hypothetical protein [Aequorivita sinensis]
MSTVIKIPPQKFDVKKYIAYHRKLREDCKEGKLTRDELSKLTDYSKQRREINKHIEAINKIAEDSNMPITISYYEFNKEAVFEMQQELFKEVQEYKEIFCSNYNESI